MGTTLRADRLRHRRRHPRRQGVQGGADRRAVGRLHPGRSTSTSTIDYESLKTVGAMMGSGGLVVMDEDTCMVDMAKFFMDFIQRESCGKCIPCREGTRRMLRDPAAPSRAAARQREGHRGPGAVQERAAPAEPGRDHPRHQPLRPRADRAQPGAVSTLRWFRDEYEAHIYDRQLPGAACTELLTYSIDTDAVHGLHAVREEVPGRGDRRRAKKPALHRRRKCIGCGSCVDVCRFDAVERS